MLAFNVQHTGICRGFPADHWNKTCGGQDGMTEARPPNKGMSSLARKGRSNKKLISELPLAEYSGSSDVSEGPSFTVEDEMARSLVGSFHLRLAPRRRSYPA